MNLDVEVVYISYVMPLEREMACSQLAMLLYSTLPLAPSNIPVSSIVNL
jgi:hypothetical protein